MVVRRFCCTVIFTKSNIISTATTSSCRLSAFVLVLGLSNLATGFASAVLAKDIASEGGVLVDKDSHKAVATSQAMKMYAIGEPGSDAERSVRRLQAGTFLTTVPVNGALEMLLDCYEGKETVEVIFKESNGQEATKVICRPGGCTSSMTSRYTMKDAGVPCTRLGATAATTCVPVEGEVCTGSNRVLFKLESGTDFYTITMTSDVPMTGGGFQAAPFTMSTGNAIPPAPFGH